jgi:hypothetical protein
MFSWFKQRRKDKDDIDSLAIAYDALREDHDRLETNLVLHSHQIEKNKTGLFWQDEKPKSALRMISILEEISDYDVEIVSSSNRWIDKKEKKAELLKKGYVYITCIEGDEIYKKRKE